MAVFFAYAEAESYRGEPTRGPTERMADVYEIFDLGEGFFAFLIILGLVALTAWGASWDLTLWGGTPPDTAEEILRERFARGDISAGEYEDSLKTLRESQLAEAPPPKTYEDYVREAMGRLRASRGGDS